MALARRLLPIAPAVLALALPLAAAPVPVAGRVAGPRGEPVAGARVALVRQAGPHELGGLRLDGIAGPEPAARAETDRQGRFTVAAPEPGMWKLAVEARGYLPLARDLVPLLEAAELPTAVLTADEGLTVHVVDESGRPLAARLLATVSTAGGGSTPDRNGPGWEQPARLAAAGADGLARLPRGAGERLSLAVAALGRSPVQIAAPGRPPGRMAAPGRPPARMTVAGGSARVVLAPGVPRAVRVLDERGRPVAGALVSEPREDLPLGRTDAKGRWTAAVPARGDLMLRLAGADGGQASLRLAVAPAGTAPAEPEATVRLAPRRALSGRVVGLDTRRPVAGALVWEDGDPARFARADRAGGYTLQVGGPARILLRAGASGYVPGSEIGGRGAEGPTVALLPAGVLEGTVADGAGRPLAGAEVAARPKVDTMRARVQLGVLMGKGALTTRSSAGGRFRLAGVPAGFPLTLVASRPGLLTTRQDQPELRPAESRSGLRLVLAAGRRGTGLVVDRARRPVAGAWVIATEAAAHDRRRRLARRQQSDEEPSAWTDAAGRFLLPALAPGRYDLAVEAAGFAPVEVPGIEVPAPAPAQEEPEPEGEVALGTVTLSPGVALPGRVVDDRKQPVAGAEIAVEAAERAGGMRPPSLRSAGPPSAVSDADGLFTVRDLRPGGGVDLTVTRPGYAAQTVPGLTPPAAAPVEVVLRRSGRVAGRVLDAGGKPVEGAVVMARVEHTGSARFVALGGATSEADGGFEIEDVPPGGLEVEAEAAGLQPARLAGLELPAGGELAGLELVMEPGAAIEGRVLAADGLPVVGADVLAGDPSGGQLWPGQGGSSDGDGRYRVDGLAPGHLTVSAEHPGRGRVTSEIDVRPGVNPLDLTFEPGFEVSGRVVDSAGEPVAGAELVLRSPRYLAELPHTVSAADGSFSLPAVATGTYSLTAGKGTARLRSETTVEVRGAPVVGVVVRLDLGRAVLTGRLSGVPPAELGGVSVDAFGPAGSHRGRVDFRGTYRVEGLAPGDWKVRAQVGNGGRSARGEVAIPEGATEATLDLDFAGGLTLRGKATRGGAPVAGASVFLRALGGGDSSRAETDASGAFRLEGLSPGRYRLELVDLRTGLRHSREVDLAGDRQVAIALETARVAGHVRDAGDGKPLAGAIIGLDAADAAHAANTAGAEPSFQGRQETASDSRGYFSFGAVTEGRVHLRVTLPGYAEAERVLDLGGEGSEEVELQLQATEGIRFQPVAASGLPAGPVLLAVVDAAGRAVVSGQFDDGAEGEVRVSTVPAGSWELLVRPLEGGATLSLPITAPGALGRLQLPAGGDLEAIVPALDGSTAAATATLSGPDGRPYREPSWSGGVRASWPVIGGRLSLSALPAGRLTVTVTAADGRTWTGTVDVTPGGRAQVSLR